ncbi:MAG: radical SAM protein [Bacteriovoracaceae bacterium]|nr:radical SAM protein [Bacteriovoracaceae bacterium]
MKIALINPPVIRSKNSSPENNFKIEGILVNQKFRKILGVTRAFNFLNKVTGANLRFGVRAGSRWPFTMDERHDYAPFPFFMAYSASLLKKNGFEVELFDAISSNEYNYDIFLEKVKASKPDIVLIECSTPTIDIDIWFAKRVSEFAEVALAGPHLASHVESVKKSAPFVSYFLKGEYISSSLKMAQEQRKGVYETEVVKDVDSIPFPFRDYEGWQNTFDASMPTAQPQLQLYGSKGCPFKCTFCSWPQTMYFGNVALRKPENIAQEIREAVSLHGYKSIFFDDDTFNLGTDRISQLCDYLKEISLPWTMMGRLDCSPDWLYDKMVESGCVGMRFGIETFNLEVLKNVKKGIERKDFRATLEHIATKYPHVMIHLTMMTDMPGMTNEMHLNDMEILRNIGFSSTDVAPVNIFRSFQLSKCVPFPGTELYREMKEKYGDTNLDKFKYYDGGQDTIMKKV